MNPTKSEDLAEKLVKVKRQRDELLKAAKDVVLQYRNFDGRIIKKVMTIKKERLKKKTANLKTWMFRFKKGGV